jgi:TctA family transporter
MTQLAAERLLLALLPEAISCKGGSQYFSSVLLALLGALSLLALWRTRRPATQADAAPFFVHAGRFALALCLVAAYAAALPHVLSLPSVTGMVVGMLAGLVIGALPGLAVVAGVALLIPLTFGINASVFDLWVMLGVGLLGYAMDRLDFPTAPAVLGMLLGPMAENELRLALTISMGDASVLFGSVASWMTIACTVLVFISPWLRKAMAARRAA